MVFEISLCAMVAVLLFCAFKQRQHIKSLETELLDPMDVRLQKFEQKMNALDFSVESPILSIFVTHLVKIIDNFPGAENYLTIDAVDPKTLRKFEFTMRRKSGLTPSDLAGKLRDENKELKSALSDLVEELDRCEILFRENKDHFNQAIDKCRKLISE